MIRTVVAYQCVCDRCKRVQGVDWEEEYFCWESEDSALTVALESDWVMRGEELLCPKCRGEETNDETERENA